MSAYKMVQMILRGFVLLLMGIGFFLNSEVKNLNRIDIFFQSGVFSSCLIVSAGLMVEAGLQVSFSDDFIETFFILTAIFLNLVAGCCAFYEFYSDKVASMPEITINKGFIAFMTIGIYMIDLCLIFCKVA